MLDEEKSKTEASATVKAGAEEAATAELTDEYTKNQTGNLVITKSIDGLNVTESEFEGALKFEVTTTVKGEDGEEVTKWLDAKGKVSDEKVELTLKDFTKGEDGR